MEWSKKLGKRLGLKYCYGFQYKKGAADGVPKILECNPRVQGGMAVVALAGANIIMGAVLVALGQDCDFGWHVKDGTVMQRYWGMIGVNRNGVGLGGTNQ